MVRLKRALQTRSLTLCLQLALLTSFSTLILVPQTLLAQGIPERWEASAYQPPQGLGRPGRREGAGTRGPGNCYIGSQSLTALMPVDSFGATVAAYPTFSFYMPPIPSQIQPKQVEFELSDEEGNTVYATMFTTTGEPGIINLTLPADAGLPPLKVGQNYRWHFAVICAPQERGRDLAVEGWIRRVELNAKLDSQLKQVSLKNRPNVYAGAEIWYDALTALAQLKRSNPNDPAVTSEWAKLLQSVGLEKLAKEPLVTIKN